MNAKSWITVAAAVLLTAFVTHTFFPQTKTEILPLPGKTETTVVTQEKIDTIWEERVETRWRERVTTDTLVLADTIWQTEVETVAVLPARWYLDSASIAEERGDTSYYRLTWLQADSGSIQRRDALERHVTLGPVRQISTGPDGLSVDYGEPRTAGCDLKCRFLWGVGTWSVLRIGEAIFGSQIP